jgi:CRISPR-associated protein (TIGR02710 family)
MNAAPIQAVLVSVGGSPAPVLFTLRKHRPKHVWYFCSGGSRDTADEIHAQLDWHPDRDFIEVERFEELGPCYRELWQAIPALLERWKVKRTEVLVDYTGGTKTMSAALVLAGTEFFDRFSYVGGEQRDKGGMGVTLDGRERFIYQSNPWFDLAIREVERAGDLWAGCQFDAAAKIFRETADRVPPHPHRFKTMAAVAEGLAARHRLDFRSAVKHFGGAVKELPLLFDGREDAGPLAFARASLEICIACSEGKASEVFLRELLDNALRTAAQHRYEDAAARLYRAMEMQGQIWIGDATGGIFQNGRVKPGNALPDSLAGLDFCTPDARGEVKLSLEQIYLALNRLGDDRAASVAADLARQDKSRWRQATEKRNTSILGHGVTPIRAEGFEAMKQIAAEFLGFDLSREMNPIPPLDSRWL